MPWGTWSAVTEWVERWRADEDTADRSEDGSLFDPLAYDPEALETRTDISLQLGLTPAQFVRRIIAVEDGKIRQQDVSKYGDFSDSTVSRMLQKLEGEGEIKRFQFGREKVVIAGEKTLPTLESSRTNPGAELSDKSREDRTQKEKVPRSW